jgi:phage terminase large subunit
MKITIPYKPRNWAKVFHESARRWIVLVLHRRAGKTTGVLNHLQRDAVRVTKSQYAFIAPTYKQAKRIAWEILKDIARPIPGTEANEAELTMKYPNGSKIFLAGSENVDALRGIPLWGGGQDESSQQPSNLFTEVISKCLADHLGYWIWAGTPKGKNGFYKTYQVALKNPEHYSVVFRTIDDSLRDEQGETIDNLRKALEDDRRLVEIGEMTQEEFDQEWYCSFEAAIKGAYYAKQIAKARVDGRIKKVPYDPAIPVHTVTDLGIGKNLATGFYQKPSGKEVHMIDFWQGTEKDGIPEMAKMLQGKPYIYGKHFAPHDIKATEQGTGKTKLETAKTLGIKFLVVQGLKVDDGINAGRLMFARLWVDEEKCEYWLDAISQYHQEWDETRGMFVERPYHDWTSHPADVHRYASIIEDKMSNEEQSFIAQDTKQSIPESRYEGKVSAHITDEEISEQELAKM